MGLFDFFLRPKSPTASVAKDRLQILVSHERAERNKPDWLQHLQGELLKVVRRYVHVGQDAISVRMEQDDNRDVLELNITLPDAKQITQPVSAQPARPGAVRPVTKSKNPRLRR